MKIVCLGDSLTYGFMLPRKKAWPGLLNEVPGINSLNKGINGDSTSGMLSRFQKDVVEENPSRVIIMGGTNDFLSGLSVDLAYSNIMTMVHQAYFYKIKPMVMVAERIEGGLEDRDRMVNEKLDQLARRLIEKKKELAFDFLDLKGITKNGQGSLDGIHYNAEVNSLIKEKIINIIID